MEKTRRKESLRRRRRQTKESASSLPTHRTTSLFGAAAARDAELVGKLIREGWDPNEKDNFYLPPSFYVINDHHESEPLLDTLSALLEGGADPNATEGHGITLLMLVASRGWTKTAKLLIDHKAGLYHESFGSYDTALHKAIQAGNLATADFLAGKAEGIKTKGHYRGDRGKPVLEIRNRQFGQTPYLAACNSLSASVEMLLMLEQHGANTQATTPRKQNAWHLVADACLHHAFDGSLRHCSSLKLQHLFELGLPGMDTEDGSGRTPLHYAAHEGCITNISMLILFDAKIDHQGKNGMTPLVEAVEKIHPTAVKLLLKAGANPHIRYHIEGAGWHTPERVAFRPRGNMGKPWNGWIRAMRQAFDEAKKKGGV